MWTEIEGWGRGRSGGFEWVFVGINTSNLLAVTDKSWEMLQTAAILHSQPAWNINLPSKRAKQPCELLCVCVCVCV